MANNPYVTGGSIGIDLTDVSSIPKYPRGLQVETTNGRFQYVYALSDISQYAAVLVDASQAAYMVTTTNAVNIKRVGFAQVSIASAFYGWVQQGGKFIANLATNCAPNVPLFTTATAGVLDDATVSAGFIMGMTATNTISNATAVTCVAGYPQVGWYSLT